MFLSFLSLSFFIGHTWHNKERPWRAGGVAGVKSRPDQRMCRAKAKLEPGPWPKLPTYPLTVLIWAGKGDNEAGAGREWPAQLSATSRSSYLVNLLLEHLPGHLQVLQSHPQLLVLLLQTAPLLLHTVQLAVEADGHVLRHLRTTREWVQVMISAVLPILPSIFKRTFRKELLHIRDQTAIWQVTFHFKDGNNCKNFIIPVVILAHYMSFIQMRRVKLKVWRRSSETFGLYRIHFSRARQRPAAYSSPLKDSDHWEPSQAHFPAVNSKDILSSQISRIWDHFRSDYCRRNVPKIKEKWNKSLNEMKVTVLFSDSLKTLNIKWPS